MGQYEVGIQIKKSQRKNGLWQKFGECEVQRAPDVGEGGGGAQGSNAALYDTRTVATCYHTCVQTHTVCNTRRERSRKARMPATVPCRWVHRW